MSTDGVVGAAFLPSDGYLDPSQLCYALAGLARGGGVRIASHTRVTGIDVRDGRVHRVRTDHGDVDCEVVVDCGGMFAPANRPGDWRTATSQCGSARGSLAV